MRLDHLRALEAKSIQIIREVVAEFERPVMLYSIGKDSSVLVRLAQKAFHPGPIPFPLLHVDTTYKFREMIAFRDRFAAEIGARLIVHTNAAAVADGTQPFAVGTQRCCGLLKTTALLDALRAGSFDAAFGGARRDEERSRAKERIFSLRDARGQWDPKRQRPELWSLLNGRIGPGESIRVFPLSNWTEVDVWRYIDHERIPVVPLYFAKPREVIVRGDALIPVEQAYVPLLPGERPQRVMCRMRSLGCSPCTGAIRSTAATVPAIIDELLATRHSERQLRVIDHESRRIDGNQETGGLLLMADLVRICTTGSVDDGKSTLIGRLLYDSRGVYDDQLHSVEQASRTRSAGPIDFSLFTDGLRAEREQGITIDVAYRHFATPRRSFILADTPGHEQYTPNMATGASTADVAILLVDARHGVREQTRRHARIASLLGISTFVLAANKMDLVDFDPGVFDEIRTDFARLLPDAVRHAIPVSALHGDNVTTRSERTPWFDGASLLEFLEAAHVDGPAANAAFRFPVQLVVRSSHDFRGYAGQIASGTVRAGDEVTVWPSGLTTTVSRIVTWDGDLESAAAPMSVTIVLDDDIDVGRGDVLAIGPVDVGTQFEAQMVWMDERPLEPSHMYALKHATRTVTVEADRALALNDIGTVRLKTSRPIVFDPYARNRTMGSVIVIDPATHFTAGAGMIMKPVRERHAGDAHPAAAERLVRAARAASSEADAVEAVRRALEEMLT